MVKYIELKDFPGYYVNSDGEIFSSNYKRTKITKKMKPSYDKKGYLFVSLCKNGKRYIRKVHRLIAQAFLLNPNNKPQVNHINGIHDDNRIENLEFCTNAENTLHAYRVLGRKGSIKGKKRYFDGIKWRYK